MPVDDPNEPIIYNGDCTEIIKNQIPLDTGLTLSFLDPPFNQKKEYDNHADDIEPEDYWNWMKEICQLIYDRTKPSEVIYFMQREKNTENVLRILREAG